jgi:hypothetical protein
MYRCVNQEKYADNGTKSLMKMKNAPPYIIGTYFKPIVATESRRWYGHNCIYRLITAEQDKQNKTHSYPTRVLYSLLSGNIQMSYVIKNDEERENNTDI